MSATARPRLRTTTTVAAALVLLLGVSLLSAVPVAADHAFSHRWVVAGRVLDITGEPANGIPVEVELKGPGDDSFPEGPCSYAAAEPLSHDMHQRVSTNAVGDYFACFHVHSIMEKFEVIVRVAGQEQILEGDIDNRVTYANFRLVDESPLKDPDGIAAFSSSYTVRGKIFTYKNPSTVEGILVRGTTPIGATIDVLIKGTGINQTLSVQSNQYGDYEVVFSDPTLANLPADLKVIVDSERSDPKTSNADRTNRVTYHNVRTSSSGGSSGDGLPIFSDGDSTLMTVAIIAAIVAALGVAVIVGRRMGAASARKRRLLSLRNLSGIGGGTYAKLEAANIYDLRDLAAADPEKLAKRTKLKTKATKRWVAQAKEHLEKHNL